MQAAPIIKTIPSDTPDKPAVGKSRMMVPLVTLALLFAGLFGVVVAAAVKILISDLPSSGGTSGTTPFAGTSSYTDICSGNFAGTMNATTSTPASTVSALKAAASGTTAGTAITINYVKKSGFQGMAIGLMIDGVTDEPQQSLIDLGSSTAAFCNTSLPALLAKSSTQKKTAQAQCNQYGNRAEGLGWECDLWVVEHEAVLTAEWFYGSVYNGSLVVQNSQGNPNWRLTDVGYTVMDERNHMTCSLGFGGIFGVAFEDLNTAYLLPSGTSASDMLLQPSECGSYGYASCQTSGYTEVADQTPIMQALAAAGEHRFGIHTDISKLSALSDFSGVAGVASDGTTVYNKGTLYIGANAQTNEHYTSGTKRIALTYPKIHSSTNPNLYWSFDMTGYTTQGTTTSLTCGSQTSDHPCIIDSGNPTIDMPASVVTAMGGTCDSSGNVQITATDWPTVTLHLVSSTDGTTTVPIYLTGSFLKKISSSGWLACGTPSFTLGLPITELYYLVFDDDADSITFVWLNGDEP